MTILGTLQANSWRQSGFPMVLFPVGSACSCRQATQESLATLPAALSADYQGRQLPDRRLQFDAVELYDHMRKLIVVSVCRKYNSCGSLNFIGLDWKIVSRCEPE